MPRRPPDDPAFLASTPIRERKPKEKAKPKRKVRDEDHLAFIRSLPCCVCGAPAPSDPHHLMRVPKEFNTRGTGAKNADHLTVSLCRAHHDIATRNEAMVLAQPISFLTALALAYVSGDYDKGCAVLGAS